MRHQEQIESLIREALDNLIPDHDLQHRHEVRQVMDLVETRGAYPILSSLLSALGHYRLADCTAGELSHILAALENCIEANHCETYGHAKVVRRSFCIKK